MKKAKKKALIVVRVEIDMVVESLSRGTCSFDCSRDGLSSFLFSTYDFSLRVNDLLQHFFLWFVMVGVPIQQMVHQVIRIMIGSRTIIARNGVLYSAKKYIT